MSAEEVLHGLVPIVLFTSVSATVFGAVYLRSRENMALIERGINPRTEKAQARSGHLIALKYGMLIAGLGCGILAAFLIEGTFYPPHLVTDTTADGSVYTYHRQYNNIETLYFALLGIGGGLGLLISYLIEKKERQSRIPVHD